MPASVLSFAVRDGEKMRHKFPVVETNWQYWGVFYSETNQEYYIATTQDRPLGAACLVSYFAGGRFSALEKGSGIVLRHAERLAKAKKGK